MDCAVQSRLRSREHRLSTAAKEVGFTPTPDLLLPAGETGEQVHGVFFHGLGPLHKLDQVHAALTAFDTADDRLGPAYFSGEVGLSQVRGFAAADEYGDQRFVTLRAKTFRHCGPGEVLRSGIDKVQNAKDDFRMPYA